MKSLFFLLLLQGGLVFSSPAFAVEVEESKGYDIVLPPGSELIHHGTKIFCEGSKAAIGPLANCSCETYSIFYRKQGYISKTEAIRYRLRVVPIANAAAVSVSDGFFMESECLSAMAAHALCKK